MVATAPPTEPETQPDRLPLPPAVAGPLGELGKFFALTLDIARVGVTSRFAWPEFLLQTWFIARVSLIPALAVTAAYGMVAAMFFNGLFGELGGADISSAGFAAVMWGQAVPLLTALVLSGASATAMCADLGSRTVREELDAMRVMGINPAQRLFAPRVAAMMVNAVIITSFSIVSTLVLHYFYSIYISNITPGAWASNATLLVAMPVMVVCFVKAPLMGALAAAIACYLGSSATGGPEGVGNRVVETVVWSFIGTLLLNSVITALTAQMVVTT
ncbi:MlaE family ABC transporter permease [Mycolicibacterium sp. XJ1819]